MTVISVYRLPLSGLCKISQDEKQRKKSVYRLHLSLTAAAFALIVE
jgi:hypothetical protein